MSPPSPSALYDTLHALALAHAQPQSLAQILSIRAPSAVHSWGHTFLVARSPGLRDRMDNAAFEAHLTSTGRFLEAGGRAPEVHDVVVDERRRTAAVRMSYFLRAKGAEEVVEQDLVWLLKFTDRGEGEGDSETVLIRESVEFIDAAASARVGTLVRAANGGGECLEVAGVKGGITLTE